MSVELLNLLKYEAKVESDSKCKWIFIIYLNPVITSPCLLNGKLLI